MQVDKVAEAVAPYKEAVELQPNNFLFNFNYGLVLLSADDLEAAGEAFCKASSVYSDSEELQHKKNAGDTAAPHGFKTH
jgi:Tfp pilus assembly protein PilF